MDQQDRQVQAGDRNRQEMQLLLEEWKVVIQTQMHFNDMIIKMRTAGLSVLIAVFGGAAIAIGQYPDRFIEIGRRDFHVAAPIILFGLLLWLAIFVIDYFYYHKCLLGAVERGYQIDDVCKGRKVAGTTMYGMTTLIRDAIGKPGASKFYIWTFYLLVGLVGVAYLLLVVFWYSAK
jgi:hypothetical protein